MIGEVIHNLSFSLMHTVMCKCKTAHHGNTTFRLFYFIGMVTPGKWRAKLAFEQMLLPGGGGGLGQRLVLRKGHCSCWLKLSRTG